MAGKLTCVNIDTTQASSVTAPSINGADQVFIAETGHRYLKDAVGVVHLALNATDATGAFKPDLPDGYRPGASMHFTVPLEAGGETELQIDPSGAVYVRGASSTTQLAGPWTMVSFPTQAFS